MNRSLFCWAAAISSQLLVPGPALAASPEAEALRSIPALRMLMANLQTKDLAPMLEFYTKGLGLREAGRISLPKVLQVRLSFPGGGSEINLVERRDKVVTSAPSGTFAIFYAPDLATVHKQLKAIGYDKPFEVRKALQGLQSAHVVDPEGNRIEIIQFGQGTGK